MKIFKRHKTRLADARTMQWEADTKARLDEAAEELKSTGFRFLSYMQRR